MMKQIITLSDSAAERIKKIMSSDKNNSIGVRVGVKSGGCAGMSYIMEYTKKVNFPHLLCSKTQMKLKDVDVANLLRYNNLL